MKIEPVGQAGGAHQVTPPKQHNHREEVAPQKAVQEPHEKQIRPRKAQEGHMDVTA